MWSRAAWALPLALLVGSSAIHQPLAAQAWQCQAPAKISRPLLELAPRGEIRRTPVAGYVLALSWSPEFCRTRLNDPAEKLQCGGTIGDFGFVLHGLWPQARGGGYPAWCRAEGLLSRPNVSANICLAPSAQLLQHQWAKHGSCMARRPETYFGAAKLMFEAIEFPEMDRLSRQQKKDGRPLTAAGLAEAFATYNEGLPAEAIKVQLNERGWLDEVRICLARNFRPQRCSRTVEGVSDKAVVKIWRGG